MFDQTDEKRQRSLSLVPSIDPHSLSSQADSRIKGSKITHLILSVVPEQQTKQQKAINRNPDFDRGV